MSEKPTDSTQADWTKGVEVIRYQACRACGKAQYFGSMPASRRLPDA
jgi:hypothetical protein